MDAGLELSSGTGLIGQPERVTTKQAAKELNMDVSTVQYLMLNKQLPIGYAIRREGKKRAVYYIYRGLLDQYKQKLSGL